MFVSVIIPTYNEEDHLSLLLRCLQRQTFRNFEVIVSDADSTDKTREIAMSFDATVVAGGLPALGRNRGAEEARGDFLFFFDADIQFPDDFLENVVHEIKKRSIELATCEAKPLSDLHIDKIMHAFANIMVKVYKDSNPRIPGYCILIKQSVFDRIGGFNEDVKVAEDHDLVKRATEHCRLQIIQSTYITVSVRRFEKEGRLPYIGKSLQIALHRSLKGEITDDSIEYSFEEFSPEQNNPYIRSIIKLEKQLNRLDRKVTRAVTSLKNTDVFQKKLEKLQDKFDTLLSSVMKE